MEKQGEERSRVLFVFHRHFTDHSSSLQKKTKKVNRLERRERERVIVQTRDRYQLFVYRIDLCSVRMSQHEHPLSSRRND